MSLYLCTGRVPSCSFRDKLARVLCWPLDNHQYYSKIAYKISSNPFIRHFVESYMGVIANFLLNNDRTLQNSVLTTKKSHWVRYGLSMVLVVPLVNGHGGMAIILCWQRYNWGGVPLLYLHLPSSEENWVPIPCWVNIRSCWIIHTSCVLKLGLSVPVVSTLTTLPRCHSLTQTISILHQWITSHEPEQGWGVPESQALLLFP